MKKKQSLGKGLSALISDDSGISEDQAFRPDLPIKSIKPNPYQPRIEIKPETLVDLADSIREHGIIEPLIVTQKGDDKYELIAGERRLKAAKLADQETVPAVIKESSPQQMLEMAVVENIQRADLNPLEEALAFKELADNFNQSHDQIAQKVGLSRPAIVNKVRLLQLPEKVKKALLEERISEGHARALLGLTSKQAITGAFRKVVDEILSVRATEELVRRINVKTKSAKSKRKKLINDKTTMEYEKSFKKLLNRKVKISRSRRGGKITIPFKTDKDLKEIYTYFSKDKK